MTKQPEKRPAPVWRSSRYDEHGQKQPWPKLPPVPEFKRQRAARMPTGLVTAFANSARDPLELLSLLAGGTTFRTPAAGGGRGIGRDDLAHCLGYVKDRLQQCLALAVATHSDGEWAEVLELAYPRLLGQLSGDVNTRHLVRGKKRHRIRIVLRDAFIECTSAAKLPPVRVRATEARMRWGEYLDLFDDIKRFINTEATCGAREAVRALFAES